jgi:hypothetical protein
MILDNIKKYKNIIINVIQYLIVIFVLLSHSSMIAVTKPFYTQLGGLKFFRICASILLFCLVLYYYIFEKKRLTKKQFKFVIIALIYFAIYMLVTNTKKKSCIEGLVIPFTLLFTLCCFKKGENVFVKGMNILTNIMIFLALTSLILYFGGVLLKIIPGKTIKYFNGDWHHTINYFYLTFANYRQMQSVFGIKIFRNVGIFMEAPGYSFPLCIALFWSLFGKKDINKKVIILLTITGITTLSTKAFIFIPIIYIMYFWMNYNYLIPEKIKKHIIPVMIGIFTVLVIVFLYVKLVASGADARGSVNTRISDTLAALKTWLDYPLFGCGYGRTATMYQYYTPVRKTGSPTAGLFNILAYGGIYLFSFYAISFIMLIKNAIGKYKYINFFFVILYVIFLFMSSIHFKYMTVIMLALGWYAIINRKFNIDEALIKYNNI